MWNHDAGAHNQMQRPGSYYPPQTRRLEKTESNEVNLYQWDLLSIDHDQQQQQQ